MSRKIKKRSKPPQATPVKVEPIFRKAFALHQNGQLEEAEKLYLSILSKVPRHAQSLSLLGLIAQAAGNYKSAVKLAQKAAAITPEPEVLSNLGSAHRGLGSTAEAIRNFKKALKINPSLLEAQFNLAGSLLDCGESPEAEQWFKKVTARQPKMIEAIEGLCQTYNNQGKHDEALCQADKIIQLRPEHINAYLQRGMALQGSGNWHEARLAYEKAYELDPNQAVALNNIGNILVKQGEFHQALSFYENAISIKPDFVEAHLNLAWTYSQHGMLDKATSSYKKIIAIRPEQYHIYSDFLFTCNYDPSLSPKEHLEAACKWWEHYLLATANNSIKNAPTAKKKKTTHKKSKLRIGFLSPDFCGHPVGTFFLPLISSLAGPDYKIFCYSELSEDKHDQTTSRIREFAHKWYKSWNKSSSKVAAQIKKDRIDILIDLAGHSAYNRLDVMALRPAPIQVEWLGYVNTTGLPVIDYRLTDGQVDPPGAGRYYTEKLIRLPHGFFCYTPPQDAPGIRESPINEGGNPTFGSLNNLAKITPQVIEVWSKILAKTPNSSLLMVSQALSDDFIRQKYLHLFSAGGIDSARVKMIANLPMHEYLELYNTIDIALDPFPHNGHTISCHTLWMGVPVVVLRGDRYAARMGDSIMTRIGLPEMVAENEEQYVEIAANLAASPSKLSNLRQGMRKRLLASPMCDNRQFAADFKAALHAMMLASSSATDHKDKHRPIAKE